jgi:alkanesulfonate monooxygenase SsuD/methylene tetrahydromethanopterin reductase-like flavin-dependent oxidoreductase (luciferase family)
MKVGLLVPQGYFGEFDGWPPTRAWERVMAIAERGRSLGFDALWTGEHVLSKWDPHAVAFECATLSTALAARVPDVEIGFVVLNTTFRNPVLTAKLAGTLDALSGGRLILGLGAGFKANEAAAMGVDFPDTGIRLAILAEHLEIISRLTRADGETLTFSGRYARADGAVNVPATSGRDHVPLLIGGHGRNVTFRLAARYCDEINIDLLPSDMPAALTVLADRCAEVGRDPVTLRVSATIGPAWPYVGLRVTGRQRMMTQADIPAVMDGTSVAGVGTRVEEMIAWRELGIDRLVVGAPGMADTDEAIEELVEDLSAAGIPLRPPPA